MRRLFALLVIAPPASAAGFYLASFVYRLVTHLSFYVASVGLIVLTLLGIISRKTPKEAYGSVTCRLTVVEIAQLPGKLSRCVAEVEGILVSPEGSTRFELQQEGVRQ
jgi:hypothetical protein